MAASQHTERTMAPKKKSRSLDDLRRKLREVVVGTVQRMNSTHVL
jgi:hypothetical protein